MTPTGLRRELESLGVRRNAYGILVERDEAYCLLREGEEWLVFYSERGHRNDERRFTSKEDACTELHRRITADPTSFWNP